MYLYLIKLESTIFTLFPYTTLFRSCFGSLRELLVCLCKWTQGLLPKFFTNQARDRKSTRLNSSHTVISYAVFCLKKKIILIITMNIKILFNDLIYFFILIIDLRMK